MAQASKWRNKIPILLTVACIFIGTMTGFILKNLTAGILIGIGAGLILAAVLRFILFRKKIDDPDSKPQP